MSDPRESHPRRNWSPQGEEAVGPATMDDTASTHTESVSEPEGIVAPNPFARPGSPASRVHQDSLIPPPVLPANFSWDDPEEWDDVQPQPRRSALSSLTPPEDDSEFSSWASGSDAAPRRSVLSGPQRSAISIPRRSADAAPRRSALTAPSPTDWEDEFTPPPQPRRSALTPSSPSEEDFPAFSPWAPGMDAVPRRSAISAPSPSSPFDEAPRRKPKIAPPAAADPAPRVEEGDWWAHHRKALLLWTAAVLAIAVFIALGLYYSQRSDPAPPPAPSPSPSETMPVISETALLSVEDAKTINESATWAITATSTDPADQRLRAACLSTDPDLINPTISMQRSLGTTEDAKLAALHQIDVYATPEAAQQVLQGRVTSLAACSEVPARIVAATTVSALSDDTHQLTLVYENEENQFHTMLLTRTGSTLSILDVSQLEAPVEAQNLVATLQRPLTEVCSLDGTCPGTPEVAPVVVPPTEPVGWLVPSDLPRIRPGVGRWTSTAPGELTSSGMGCEDLTLVTEPGPTERAQSTLVMTQDDQAPEGFGLDEMRFTFDDDDAAAAFAKKLGDNLAGCQDRVFGTTVVEHPAVTSVGAEDIPVSARSFSIERESESNAVRYQLALTVSGNRVTYMLATVKTSYQFSEAQLSEIAKRLGERATQA